jgi:hypothetical protein
VEDELQNTHELQISLDRLRESVDALREVIDKRLMLGGVASHDDDVHGKLQTLSRLLRDDLISEDDYDERKDDLLRRWNG